jgi:hypothetical protein
MVHVTRAHDFKQADIEVTLTTDLMILLYKITAAQTEGARTVVSYIGRTPDILRISVSYCSFTCLDESRSCL